MFPERARKQAKQASLRLPIPSYICTHHPCMSPINQPINLRMKERKATKCFLPSFLSASQTRQDRQFEVIKHNHHIIAPTTRPKFSPNQPKPDQNHTTYRADTIINAHASSSKHPLEKGKGKEGNKRGQGETEGQIGRWIDR